MRYGIINYIGVSYKGLGKNSFSEPIKRETLSFMELKSKVKGKNLFPYIEANIEEIKNYYSLKDIRRLDKYVRISLLLTAELTKNLNERERENLGTILATTYGSFKTNCDFLDTIIFQGFERASPLYFTGTVHNSPFAPMGILKGVKGPSWCISNFENTFDSSLYVTKMLLISNICEKVLLLFVDELCPLVIYGLANIMDISEENLEKVPMEGGVGFLLGKENILITLEEIEKFKSLKKLGKNYGFTYYPKAFELLIGLNEIFNLRD